MSKKRNLRINNPPAPSSAPVVRTTSPRSPLDPTVSIQRTSISRPHDGRAEKGSTIGVPKGNPVDVNRREENLRWRAEPNKFVKKKK